MMLVKEMLNTFLEAYLAKVWPWKSRALVYSNHFTANLVALNGLDINHV